MTREEKDILLKDLCTRLPYEVKCDIEFDDGKVFHKRILMPIMIQDFKSHENLKAIKSYLFPLSSMTEEQKEEYHNLCSVGADECGDIIYFNTYESIDYLNKNKFDYRYLIPMGLAIDATGLNIY